MNQPIESIKDLIEMAKIENADITSLFNAAHFRGWQEGKKQAIEAIIEKLEEQLSIL